MLLNNFKKVNINQSKIGMFIGPKGSNIKRLMEFHKDTFYQIEGKRGSVSVNVYADNQISLTRAVLSVKKFS